jgi:hypothetical protein
MHRSHSMTQLSLLLAGTLLSFAPGCGKSGSKGGASQGGSARSPGQQPKPVELVEYALNKAGPEWAGFSAKAPTACKVMGDLGSAARIAGKGPGFFCTSSGTSSGPQLALTWPR